MAEKRLFGDSLFYFLPGGSFRCYHLGGSYSDFNQYLRIFMIVIDYKGPYSQTMFNANH